MPGPAFHPDDAANALVPADAFNPSSQATPGVYALQNHLALEVVAHLQESGVPFQFRGGTALHTKLPTRRRFSIDVDLITPDVNGVHKALKRFTERFPKSGVSLREPPGELQVEGVRHTLTFEHSALDGSAPVRILVEVVEGS